MVAFRMTSPASKNWLTLEEASVLFGVSVDQIRAWIIEDGLPARKSSTAWKVYNKTITLWLEMRGHQPLDCLTKRSVDHMTQQSLHSLQLPLPIEPISKEPQAHLFAKALMKDAIMVLPTLPETTSVEQIRDHVRSNIHYNSVQTRERFTAYILKHLFPSGKPDLSLIRFAKKYSESSYLKDVCLYRFIISQPLMRSFINDLLLKAVGQGSLPKSRLLPFLKENFPKAKEESLKSTVSAICEVLTSCSVAQVERGNIRFALRVPTVESFAFILHSEFPKPGVYNLSVLNTSNSFISLLWNTDKLTPLLYELRNAGLIAKISNIDSVQQFATKYTLEELVEHLGHLRVSV